MSFLLTPNAHIAPPSGPVVLVILDGVGVGNGDASDAVKLARTPTLHRLRETGLYRTLRAHGTAVGMPSDDDMGNSEVGHNAMGCGRIYDQGALQVNRAIASGALFAAAPWQQVMACTRTGGAVHFLGLLSDGNVHSHIQHLIALLRHAAQEGAKKLYVHALLDGRDVPRTSALTYVDALEAVLAELRQSGIDAQIASGGGRMFITMDRYNADWNMVERGWRVHVHGDGRPFSSAREAILTFRDEHKEVDDQNLPSFVVARGGQPVAPIRDGDAVVCFNFRGDRAIEISRAFEDEAFPYFDRGVRPRVTYAGMMQYDGDTQMPHRFLVQPPAIERTLSQYLVENKVSQLAISETQKYGHVTYFWNGNRSGRFDEKLETFCEIPSDVVPFEERPWMKAAEITDRLIEELRTGRYRFGRVNYANGDMVGHTGSLEATILAVESVDLQLARLVQAVDAMKGRLVITADHGNADEMFQHDKAGSIVVDKMSGAPVAKTSHTLNPVPLIVHAPDLPGLSLATDIQDAGISNVPSTCVELLGLTATGRHATFAAEDVEMKMLIAVVVAAALGVGALYVFDSQKTAPAAGVPGIGVQAHTATCTGASPDCLPRHTLKDIDGHVFDPPALAGKVVVVNVWATWCKPCQKEIPAFAKVHDEYKDKGVVILGLLAEFGATLDQIRIFAKTYGMNYPIIFMEPEVGDSFGNPSSLPSTYIYDKQGNLFRRHVGELTHESLIAEIKAAGAQ